MKQTFYLTACRLVGPDATIDDASLLIEDGVISEICPQSVPSRAVEISLRGRTVMPGLIDLHSDAIERVAEPRTGIYLPFDLAAIQIDRLSAACGITTLFNAISFAGEELGLREHRAPAKLVEAVAANRPHACTDQRVHCRFEVTYGDALPDILSFIENGACHFVSYMDHSPGQGQFTNEENYRDYMSTRYGYAADAITELIKKKQVDRDIVKSHVRELATCASTHAIPLAGHDADSKEHVAEMRDLGAALAEFPMSWEAARATIDAQLHQSVGSVNVIRGGSQRTGMSARDLVAENLADCLCSDYVPATLLPAVFLLSERLEKPLHQTAKLVTKYPATAAGLTDRGSLEPGKRADLVVITTEETWPRVVSTWVGGKPIYSIDPPTIAAINLDTAAAGGP